MKKQIFTFIQLVIVLVIMAGTVTVFAGFSPADQTTNGPKPVDLGGNDQVIKSAFGSRKFLKAGIATPLVVPSTVASPTWNDEGVIVAEKNAVSPYGILQDVLLPGKQSQVKIGSTSISADLPASQPFTGDTTTPLIIDMRGRGTTVNDRAGREAIELAADWRCNAYTTLKTNTAAVELASIRNTTGKADIIARQLQLNEPNAGTMKVLVATDTAGNAVWGTMKVVTVNGVKKIQVDYPGSVVATGQNSCAES